MATASQPRPIPNLDIYNFEGQFETGFSKGFSSLFDAQTAKQQDKISLITPRIECRYVSGQQEQHSYIVQNTNGPQGAWTYQNEWNGVLFVKIVTNRVKEKSGLQHHRKMRSIVRWVAQDYINYVNAFMPYISLTKVLETGCSPSFSQEQEEEISALAYNVIFAINGSSFPTPTT